MNYKNWLVDDLKDLNRMRFSISQMKSELQTLDAEFTAIKATDYDKIPGGTGGNVQEEKLLSVLARKEELRTNLEATQRHVLDLDRLLAALSDEERRVVDRMFVNRERYAQDRLSEELGYESAQIYRVKNRALLHMAQMRFGKGYQP